MNAALHCSHRTATDLRDIVVGNSLSRREKQNLPLLGRQLHQGITQVLEVEVSKQSRRTDKKTSILPLYVLDLPPLLPTL